MGILQVLPSPARPEWWAAKVTLIANQIAGDALDARVGERGNKRLKPVVDIAAMQPRVDGWVAPAIHNQIAVHRACVVRFGRCVKRGPDPVIRTEAIQRQGNRVEFGVGGGAEQLLRIVLEQSFARIE